MVKEHIFVTTVILILYNLKVTTPDSGLILSDATNKLEHSIRQYSLLVSDPEYARFICTVYTRRIR